MRLICPNCGAQYEVADDVIPEAGRDVQCSNCGHTWFERPGASEAAEAAAMDETLPTPPEPQAEPDPAPEPEPEPEPEPAPDVEAKQEPEPAPEPEPEEEADRPAAIDDADEDPAPQDPPQPERRELDPGVADILREEAQYEQAAREAEQGGLESQPDLGLTQESDDDRRSREARDRLARLRGEPEPAPQAEPEPDAPRRELLPDIDEINSTLRPDAGPADAVGAAAATQRTGGFRRGFMLMVLLALIAVALYVFAPQISAAVPQTEAALSAYVDWVNGLRIWLDQQIEGFIERSGAPAETAPAVTDDAASGDS